MVVVVAARVEGLVVPPAVHCCCICCCCRCCDVWRLSVACCVPPAFGCSHGGGCDDCVVRPPRPCRASEDARHSEVLTLRTLVRNSYHRLLVVFALSPLPTVQDVGTYVRQRYSMYVCVVSPGFGRVSLLLLFSPQPVYFVFR